MPKEEVKLKKALSFPTLLFYSTGTILGLGIYVILGKVAGQSGMFTPLAFIVAAIIAIFSAISYGELSARIPKSGGAVITQLNQGAKTVVLKARGKSISRAVDVAEMVKNRFAKDLEVKDISISTEEVSNEDGSKIRVSAIEITLQK